MACSKRSNDPIARRIYADEGLILLGRAFEPAELPPGKVLRKPAGAIERPPVLTDGALLFEGWSVPEPRPVEFRRLSRSTLSETMKASAAAELATVLTGAPDSAASVSAALASARVTSLRIALTGSALLLIDVGVFEDGLGSLALTDLGRRYRDEGQRAFVVTETLLVTGAALVLEDARSSSGLLEAGAGHLAKAGLRGSLESAGSATVLLDPGKDEVVIAVKLLEIDWSDPADIRLIAASGPVTIRGDAEDAQATRHEGVVLENFQSHDDLFLAVGADEV